MLIKFCFVILNLLNMLLIKLENVGIVVLVFNKYDINLK